MGQVLLTLLKTKKTENTNKVSFLAMEEILVRNNTLFEVAAVS
jgi:hypothetical protein